MPEIVYIDSRGVSRTVTGEQGATVMAVARANHIDGIVAECGGFMTCATCHVYVGPAWRDRTGQPSEIEDEMLDEVAAERRPESRLSCQIVITATHDGLTVHLPDRQQ